MKKFIRGWKTFFIFVVVFGWFGEVQAAQKKDECSKFYRAARTAATEANIAAKKAIELNVGIGHSQKTAQSQQYLALAMINALDYQYCLAQR